MISKYSSDTKEELDALHSTLGGDFDNKVVNAKEASQIELRKATQQSKVGEKHDVISLGYDIEHITSDFEDVDPKEMWTGFLLRYSPIPYMAILTHYCDLIPRGRIAPPLRMFELPHEVMTAIRRCTILQMLSRSNNMVGARQLEQRLDVLYDELMAAGPYSDGKTPQMEQLTAALGAVKNELDIWRDRMDLLAAVDRACERDLS